MRYFVLFLGLIMLTGCLQSGGDPVEDRLAGKWRSDKGKTLRWIKDHRSVRPETLKKLAAHFGKMTMEISGGKVVSLYENQKSEFDLTILGKDHDSVAVMSLNPQTKKQEILLIRFEDENTYSVYVEPLEIREFFVRYP